MNRRTVLIGASALGLAAFGGGAVFLTRRREAEAQADAATAPAVDDSLLVRAHSPILGPVDAPVTLVEFFDPSCEACRAFHPYVKQILAMYPRDVRLVIRYAAFHQGSDEAVRLLETARVQNVFLPVLEALLAEQPRWAAHHAPDLARAWQIAAKAGLDLERAQKEARAPGIDAFVRQEAADVKQANVRRTPTFFVNGKPLTSFGPQQLLDLVRSEIDARKGAVSRG